MISIDKLKNVKRLVTHANCPDGIASALIVKDALPDVEVLFVKHGTEQHRNLDLETHTGVLFCDFTPHGNIQDWIDVEAIVLDHHPTQRDVTMRFVEAGLGAYGENDRGECGAWLAYEKVWFPIKEGGELFSGQRHAVREFAELAGVRDTWKKDDPRWQAACAQAEELMFWGQETDLGNFIMTTGMTYPIGKRLFDKKLDSARTAISESHTFTTPKGTRVLMFQGVYPTSDAAELLDKDRDETNPHQGQIDDVYRPDIVAGFHYRVDAGKLQLTFSTRSHTGYDVGAFCKAYGGGGHTAAAGFTVARSPEVGANPYRVFRDLLEEWEAGR